MFDLDLMMEVEGFGRFKISSIIGVGAVKDAVSRETKEKVGYKFELYLQSGMGVTIFNPKWTKEETEEAANTFIQKIEMLEAALLLSKMNAGIDKDIIKRPSLITIDGEKKL